MPETRLPVAIIGAGPIGLAAACHLLARGQRPLVLEAGDGAGHAVRQWSHVGMFSPWELNTDKEAVKLLAAHGWRHPRADAYPTGRDLVVQYLEPLARLPALDPQIHYRTRVAAVSRKGFDKVRTAGRDDQPFVLRRTAGNSSSKQRPSLMHPALGARPTPPAPTGWPRWANWMRLIASLTASPTCLAPCEVAMRARRSWLWVAAIRRSTR
jgi:hypothetical protein